MTSKKKKSYLIGYRSEVLVKFVMKFLGWRCLYHRWLNSVTEVDLIFVRANTIRFVEVKYRSDFSVLIDMFHIAYQRKLLKAGNLWLSRNLQYNSFNIRYSIICIGPNFWNWQVNDIQP